MTKPTVKGPLTIVGMVVENFKKVALVKLKPDGSLIEIAGDNGEGKTSLLDAIWVALGGAESFPADPVRDGQQEARIELDMGEIIVTRTFRRKDGDKPYSTALKIEAANGARFDQPQTMLDQLIGKLSFEPMEFLELDDKGKFDRLKAMVPDVDFDAVEGQNKTDYERRTEENRRAKELRAQAAGIMVPAGKHEPVDVTALLSELEAAEAANKDRAERAGNRAKAAEKIATIEQECARAEEQANLRRQHIDRLNAEITALNAGIVEGRQQAEHLTQRLADAPPLPEEVDTSAIRTKIGQAETVNNLARDAQTKAELESKAAHHEGLAQALTEAMTARAEEVKAKIAAAKMPVPGLSLDGGRVTLNGHAFEDASTAEKLRTAIAVAMAMNPTVRVIRITKGGNDLDKKAMKTIADLAAEHGFQVWVERVIASGKPTVIMEDGHAKGTPDEG